MHKISAEAVLDLKIADLEIKHKFFIIPNLNHSVILGYDFLTEYKVQISYENNTVIINDDQKQTEINMITNCSKAKLTRATTLPPGTVRTVLVQMPTKVLEKDKAILLSPSTKLTELQIALVECLVPPDKDTAWIQIANFTTNSIRINRHTPIADMQLIDIRDIQNLPKQGTPQVNNMQETLCTNNPTNTGVTLEKDKPKKQDLNFDLSNSDLNEKQKQDLFNLLHEYRDCFATGMHEIGCTPLISHAIDTTDDIPVRSRAYKTSPETKKILEREVQTLLDNDIIEHSSSDYSSPVILIKKPNNTYRLVVDFRKLNQKVKDVVFPLPLLSDVIDQIGTSKSTFFSSMDLKSGYHQVMLSPESRHKTAFICHHGLFQFKRMVMGLSTSSSTFQKLMNNVFKGLSWHILLCYLDDVLVHSPTFEDHLQHLRLVFERLRMARLTLTPSKCFFGTKHVKFLGYNLTKDGATPSKSNTQAIDTFPTPKTQKQVRQFLGMAGYYRKFVKDYSRIAYPLFKLLTKHSTNSKGNIEWNPECERAFKDLKLALTTEPVILKYPTTDKTMYLTTDGSKKGVSYILSQEDDKGTIHPICYGGKSLRPEQTNWPVSHIELYAIILGIREYRPYLASCKFKILTDCKSLTWLRTTKHTNGRLIRWNLELMQYNFDIAHLPGKSNTVADCLSRRSYDNEEEQQAQTKVDKREQQSEDIQSMVKLKAKASSNADNVIVTSHNQNTQKGSEQQGLSTKHESQEGHTDKQTPEAPNMSENAKQAFIRALQTGEDPNQSQIDVGVLQETCDELKPLYMYLKNDTLPTNSQHAKQIVIESQQYAMLNNRLYHLYQPRAKNRDPKGALEHQLDIPKCLRPDVLHAFHDSAIGACHPGFKRTFEALRMRYYWKHMYQQVFNYTATCEICQEMKRDTNKREAPLKPYQVDPVFSRWHIDFLSGLPTTKNKNKNILLAIDSFSHWTEAFALPTQSADEVARVIYESLICRWGVPDVIVSDNAANFNSKVLNALYDTFHIKNQRISSYAPRSNGIVEKQNATLTQGLRALCSKEPECWDNHLSSVMMAFRMSPSLNSTGYSPFYLLTGQQMQLPIDNILENRPNITGCLQQYIEDMTKNLQIIRDTAKQNILKHKQLFKARHDKKAKLPNFHIGQHVYVTVEHIPVGVSRKLYPRYTGPFYIVHKGKNHSYKLRHCRTNKLLKYTVHANRLKHYKDPRDHRQDRYIPNMRNGEHTHTPRAGVNPNRSQLTQNAETAVPEAPDQREQEHQPQTKLSHENGAQDGGTNAQTRPPGRLEAPQTKKNAHSTPPERLPDPQELLQPDINADLDGDISNKESSGTEDEKEAQEDQEVWYDAERLLKSKMVNRQKYYLVQWSDKSAKPSWEPESNITPRLIEQFHIKKSMPKKSRKTTKTKSK